MYFLWDSLSKQAIDIFRSLMFLISKCALELVNYTFDVFIRLGKAEFLTSSQIQSIYSRVTLILGIFMLFKMIFSFIQYLINPETITDKSKGAGKLVMKAILVVAMLGFTPYIFTSAFKLQNAIVDSNILAKVIFGKSSDVEVNNFGYELTATLFFDFYSSNVSNIEEYCDDIGPDMANLKDEIKFHGSFNIANSCLNESAEVTNFLNPLTWRHSAKDGYAIDFKWHGIVLAAVSVFVLYIILSYCLSVGIRVIQLGFLQFIAPIPILSYLGEDKDGAFSKWIKRCVSTFIDLFIRLAIIYFVVYAIDLILGENSDSYWYFLSTSGNPTGFTKTLLSIILILGMLLFAKKAPDLLKELLPQGIGSNIGFGFDFAKKMKDVPVLGGVASKVGGIAAMGGLALLGNTGAAVSRTRKALKTYDDKNGYRYGKGYDSSGKWTYGKWDKDGNLLQELDKKSLEYKRNKAARNQVLARSIRGGVSTVAAQTALGTVRGFATPTKGNVLKNVSGAAKRQVGANNRLRYATDQGSTFSGRMKERVANITGYEMSGTASSYETSLSTFKESQSNLKTDKSILDRIVSARKEIYNSAASDIETSTFSSAVCIAAQNRYREIQSISTTLSANGRINGNDLKTAYNEALQFYNSSSDDKDRAKYKDVLDVIKQKIVSSKSGTLNSNGEVSFDKDENLAMIGIDNDSSLSSAVTELVSSRKDASIKEIASYRMKASKDDSDFDSSTSDAVRELNRIKDNYSDVLSRYISNPNVSLSTTDYKALNKYRKEVQSASQELKGKIDDYQVEIDKIEQSNVKSAANANRDAAKPLEGGLKGGVFRPHGFGSGPGGPPPGPGGPPPGPSGPPHP